MDESFTAILKEMRYESNPGQKRRKKKVQVQPGRGVVGTDFANEEEDEEHEEETEEDSEGDSELENADNDHSEEEEVMEDLEKIFEDSKETTKIESNVEVTDLTGVFKDSSFDISEGMWLVVDFGDAPQDQISRHVKGKRKLFLGQVTKRLFSQEITGEFLRPKLVTNRTLFVKPPVEDIAEFDYDQVVGRTVMPEELRRGMLRIDLNSKKW